ncbi:MerR family DNA-binding transcriptional regulator [Streptomyces sp. NPDC006551]|uniref:MerR family DNA-binding transcriptional regulator n=1 Tax=Streptomyces sp. NPDC006551 TaxID=3157178 RepID=UPI0033B01844
MPHGRGVEEHLTVGRVAEPAGVSVRPLHHYDEIGLVRPSARTSAGHRVFGGRRGAAAGGACLPAAGLRIARDSGSGRRPGPPTRSRTCPDCAACCWNSATALLPW